MSLWVDKHRPKRTSQLSHSPQLTQTIQQLAKNGSDMPHLLIYGQSGAGKKTRVRCLLKDLFGQGVDKMSIHNKTFQVTSGSGASTSKVECVIMSSVWHLEMTPADNGPTQDRLVVQEVIKEIASAGNVLSSNNIVVDELMQRPSYKPIVLHNADALSVQAQHALRRTMEKYSKQIRLILVAENTSRIIAPIRSRCLGIRVAAPSMEEAASILKNVCELESVRVNGEGVMERIVEASEYNLRRALLMLEAANVQSKGAPLSLSTNIPLADYAEFLVQMAVMILNEQSTAMVMKIRTMFYEVLSKCIPASVVLKELTLNLLREHVKRTAGQNMKVIQSIIEQAAHYDSRLSLGSQGKAIYHLEAFVVNVMAILKRVQFNS